MGDAVETIYYTANGAVEITFSTHVFRNSATEADPRRGQAALNNEILVYIPVASIAVVTPNKDTVRIYRNRGDTSYTSMLVRKIEKQDAGSYTVRVA